MSAAPSVEISSPVAKVFLGRSVAFKGQILSRENLAIEGEREYAGPTCPILELPLDRAILRTR
jgi:hypothetical protein